MVRRILTLGLITLIGWSLLDAGNQARAGEKKRKIPEMFKNRKLARKTMEALKAKGKKPPPPKRKAGKGGEKPAEAEAGEAAAEGQAGADRQTVVRIVPDNDIVHLKDGSKVEGTILFVGKVAVVLHNEEGEQSIKREKVKKLEYRQQTGMRKTYKTEHRHGHLYLTGEEGSEEALGITAKAGAGDEPEGRRAGRPKRGGRPGKNRKEADKDDGNQRGRQPDRAMIKKAMERLKKNPKALEHLKKAGKGVPPGLKAVIEELKKKK